MKNTSIGSRGSRSHIQGWTDTLSAMLLILPVLAITCFTAVHAMEAVADSQPFENMPGLPRMYHVSDKIMTGYEPLGALGFESLKALGVKTIVSVDGAMPNVELARSNGMKYVHIPIGYDGIPDEAARAITRVMRDLDGPVYFHCHHGRHRGPSAAAIALRAETGCGADEALSVLSKCGTGKEYKGLWKSVADYKAPKEGAPLPELHEISPVDSLAEAMAKMDRIHDNLSLLKKAAWQAPRDHPDLSAEHEALILGESLRTAARLNTSHDREEDLWLRMKEEECEVFHLHDALKAEDLKEADRHFDKIQNNCSACHVIYRNNKGKCGGPTDCGIAK